jgi:hypothetical protein
MPTFSVRQIGSYGNGQGNFLFDLQAVQQVCMTRLKMFEGEWWKDLSDGLPLFQQILKPGAGRNPEAVSLLIQSRILGTPFVTSVQNVQTTYNGTLRSFIFSCQVNTQFGSFVAQFQPALSAAIG